MTTYILSFMYDNDCMIKRFNVRKRNMQIFIFFRQAKAHPRILPYRKNSTLKKKIKKTASTPS